MTLVLRYMQANDIQQVVVLDQQAFVTPWPARSYAYEINESNYSHMLVLVKSHEPDANLSGSGWRNWLNRLGGNGKGTDTVLGYGGLWNIADEAHISTIASHPDYRGRGYGEILLGAMIRRSVTLNAAYIILEVRVSNAPAQNLYKKYGFNITHVKRGYYRDNDEDAYELRLDIDDPEVQQNLTERYEKQRKRLWIEDSYSEAMPEQVID